MALIAAAFLLLMSAARRLGLQETLKPALMIGALAAIIILQLRDSKKRRLAKSEVSTFNDTKKAPLLSLRWALVLAAMAITLPIWVMLKMVPAADEEARQVIMGFAVPASAYLVAMKFYDVMLSANSPASRQGPFFYLWVVQAICVLAAPGIIDLAMGAKPIFKLNLEPMAIFALAAAGLAYFVLSREKSTA